MVYNAYENALVFFRESVKLVNKEERPIEYNFINGIIILVEDLKNDIESIRKSIANIQNRLEDLE